MALPLGAAAAAAARTAATKAAVRKVKEAAIKETAKGGWFQKVPKDILASPGGMILISLAGIIEMIDWIPIPLLDQIIEIPLEIIFLMFFYTIFKPPIREFIKSLIVPVLIERIPGASDISPTMLFWFFAHFDNIPILNTILPIRFIRKLFLMSD